VYTGEKDYRSLENSTDILFTQIRKVHGTWEKIMEGKQVTSLYQTGSA
jgi:hypothetical protein